MIISIANPRPPDIAQVDPRDLSLLKILQLVVQNNTQRNDDVVTITWDRSESIRLLNKEKNLSRTCRSALNFDILPKLEWQKRMPNHHITEEGYTAILQHLLFVESRFARHHKTRRPFLLCRLLRDPSLREYGSTTARRSCGTGTYPGSETTSMRMRVRSVGGRERSASGDGGVSREQH
mmetsp:Transcript_50787/g.99288  ORF Transcript_50787/g.99288 Transcript_50787/m.99288 type:complete len:179 (+) Transcript_50787:973-1509(+)